MKQVFYIVLILALAGLGGVFGWKYFQSKNTGVKNTPKTNEVVKKTSFLWGAVVRPSGLGKYHISIWNKELALAQKLGVGWVRLTWDNTSAQNDEIVKAVWDNGMDVLLVVEPKSFDQLQLSTAKDEGYNTLKPIVQKYKGKIRFYQPLNEIASTVLRGGEFSGEQESDYDQAKYKKAVAWVKGATKAIRENDSNAKVILTDQWTHFAFFDMIKKDKVDYDYLGWNWFSDMGFLGDKKITSGEKVFDKLKAIGKPIILTEVNYRPDDIKGQPEAKQADFIEDMANFAAENNNVIKGFFVHELLDVTNSPKKKLEYYGIVKAEKSKSGTYIPGEPKAAYERYQEVIKKYASQ